VAAEQSKRCRNVSACNVGDVGADDDHRPQRRAVEEALHALAEVAATLRQKRNTSWPGRDEHGVVRQDGERGGPARVPPHALNQGGYPVAGETEGRRKPRPACEPGLDPAATGALTMTISRQRKGAAREGGAFGSAD
jgi:hypothetical protein